MHVCNCSVHLLDFGGMQGFLGFWERELLQQFWPFVPVCLFCQGLRSESVELAFVLPHSLSSRVTDIRQMEVCMQWCIICSLVECSW